MCKGKIGINIEIKHAGLAVAVNDLILKHDMENEVMISSFIHEEVAEIKRLNPNLICATLEPVGSGYLPYLKYMFSKNVFFSHAKESNADAIHPFKKFVSRSLCERAHAQGLLVNPWTSDNPKE